MDHFYCLCFMSVMRSCLFVANWEMVDFLALLCTMFSCVVVTFPCGVLGQVWYLILSIPDIYLLPYFHVKHL